MSLARRSEITLVCREIPASTLPGPRTRHPTRPVSAANTGGVYLLANQNSDTMCATCPSVDTPLRPQGSSGTIPGVPSITGSKPRARVRHGGRQPSREPSGGCAPSTPMVRLRSWPLSGLSQRDGCRSRDLDSPCAMPGSWLKALCCRALE